MKKRGIWSITAVIALMVCLLAGSASNAFAADLTLSVIPDKTSALVGDTVTYTYVIANNSSDNLTGVTLTDSKFGSIALSSSTLLAGENITATKSYVIISTDLPGPIVNTASVATAENITASASASVSIRPVRPLIEVVKKADKSFAAVGDNITYTYNIKNKGNTALTGLALTDDKLGAIAVSTTSLAIGQSITAIKVYQVVESDLPGPIINKATVTATDSAGKSITAISNTVVVKLSDQNQERFTKREILQNRGVPGKGLDKAPGLQKFFNPHSRASDNAGKKEQEREFEKENNKNKNKNGHND